MKRLTRRLIISGRVQGVGFRWALHAEARALALEGWVRNRRDGTVEALISGAPEAVETLTAWAFQGPSTARVDQVLFNDEPDPRAGELEGDFRLRPTF